MSKPEHTNEDWVLDTVRPMLASPGDIAATAIQLVERFSDEQGIPRGEKIPLGQRRALAGKIVENYAKTTGFIGAATGLTGVVPGLGTVIATMGGGVADALLCMKYEIDMVRTLSYLYGHDITSDEQSRNALLIAGWGSLKEAAKASGKEAGAKALVNIIRQNLRGAILRMVKEIFKKLGARFTRKGLEKAIPFAFPCVPRAA